MKSTSYRSLVIVAGAVVLGLQTCKAQQTQQASAQSQQNVQETAQTAQQAQQYLQQIQQATQQAQAQLQRAQVAEQQAEQHAQQAEQAAQQAQKHAQMAEQGAQQAQQHAQQAEQGQQVAQQNIQPSAPSVAQAPTSDQTSYQVMAPGTSEVTSETKTGPISNNSGALKVSADKSEYHDGEVMTLKVEVPPTDGHLRIYGVGPDGSTTVLFPNRWEPDDSVHASEQRSIPADSKLNYDLVLALKPGETFSKEVINAIFSPTPFTDASDLSYKSSPFVEIGTTTVEERATRGLKPTARVQSLNVAVPYEIVK